MLGWVILICYDRGKEPGAVGSVTYEAARPQNRDWKLRPLLPALRV